LLTRKILKTAPLALLLASTSVHAQVAWTVSETDGRVAIRDESGERPARRGAKIAAGGTIETGANGSAVIVREREFVTVRPNTRLKVPQPSEERSVIQIVQDWGSAIFNIGKQPDPHFGVRTPTLAAVVKGTSFSITVDGTGSSMQVTEGAVEVWTGDGGARDLVTPGEVAGLMHAHEVQLMQPLLDVLGTRNSVRLIGPREAVRRAPTVAVALQGPAAPVAEALAAHKVMAGGGDFYAVRPLEALGIAPAQGVLRLSFVHYTSEAEVTQLIEALDRVL